MFWVLLLLPFVLLVLAGAIANKGRLVRAAVVLALIFLLLDGFALWDLMSPPRQSTGSIGVGVLALLELLVAIVLLIVSLVRSKGNGGTRLTLGN